MLVRPRPLHTISSISVSPSSLNYNLHRIYLHFISSFNPCYYFSLFFSHPLFPKVAISFTLTDDMDCSQNWLGFSLSNPHHIPSDPSQLCFFEPFNSNPGGILVGPRPDDAICVTDLSMFTSSPKLEDFLGGCCTETGAQLGQFSGETLTISSDNEIYDSELKSFLHGFSNDQTMNTQKELVIKPAESVGKKAIDNFGQRTSIYRGVTRHRWTGRYEAHLWDNSCRREGQSRKGRQVYLGGYDKEEKAARAYDLAALKYWGPTTTTNFPITNYKKEIEEMENMNRQEFVASLRRKSSGFSRGASMYRGVTRHHQHGRWQARIGRVAGNKDLYLGTFSTQEEAAEAYDIAAIKFRGLNAVTNFDMSRYDVKSIANSSLPVSGISNKSKTSSEPVSDSSKTVRGSRSSNLGREISSVSSSVTLPSSTMCFGMSIKQDLTDYWSMVGYQNLCLNKNYVPCGAPSLSQSHSLPFCMDFSQASTCNEANNGNFLNGSGFIQQQEGSCTSGGGTSMSSSIAFAAPIALNNGTITNSTSYEASGNSSWVAPSLHSFQTAKPDSSVFQTPIFGME